MARHHAIMGHEMGHGVSIRNIERSLLNILAKQLCGYHMSKGCLARTSVADFETLKLYLAFSAWMTSDGGFDAKPGRKAYVS
jgi:hypothetical protein